VSIFLRFTDAQGVVKFVSAELAHAPVVGDRLVFEEADRMVWAVTARTWVMSPDTEEAPGGGARLVVDCALVIDPARAEPLPEGVVDLGERMKPKA
jgi:hypothetical protein